MAKIRVGRLGGKAGILVGAMTLITAFGMVETSVADNEFAVGVSLHGSSNIGGVRATQEIRTNPGNSTQVIWAHPLQVFFADGDFFAVGTYKGPGTLDSGASSNCPENRTDWTSYVDGRIGGVYFCYERQVSAYQVGSTPELELVRADCPDGIGWRAKINGVSRACLDELKSSAYGAIAGLEASKAGAINQGYNIDVKHSEFQYRNSSTLAWSNVDADADPGDHYNVVRPNASRVNSYLDTLD